MKLANEHALVSVIKNTRNEKIFCQKDFCPFKTTKAVWINCLNGMASYGHTCDIHNSGYLVNNLAVFEVNL